MRSRLPRRQLCTLIFWLKGGYVTHGPNTTITFSPISTSDHLIYEMLALLICWLTETHNLQPIPVNFICGSVSEKSFLASIGSPIFSAVIFSSFRKFTRRCKLTFLCVSGRSILPELHSRFFSSLSPVPLHLGIKIFQPDWISR